VFAALWAWIPVRELVEAIRRIGPGLWFLTLAAVVAGHVLAARKWGLLLAASGASPGGRGQTIRAHAAGLFANLCLPSVIGGDVVRVGFLSRGHGGIAALAMSTVADRLVDMAGLVLLATTGAALAPESPEGYSGRVLSIAALSLLLVSAVVLGVVPLLDPGRLPHPMSRPVQKIQSACRSLLQQPAAALAALGLSLFIQGTFAILNAVLGEAIGIAAPLPVWLLAWPMAKLVATLPISLGGLGVREAALAGFLLPYGVSPVLAVAQSLVWETILIALGLLGGTAILLTRRRGGR
jgi:hypothetical protein